MVDNLKLTVKQILLNLKYILGNVTQVILLVSVILIITLLLPTVLFSVSDIYGLLTALPIVICIFSIYSSMVGQYRKSTLYSNARTTKMNRWIYNFASFLTMFLVGYSIYIFQTSLLMIMGELNLLPVSTVGSVDGLYTNFWTMNYIWNIYWVSLIILITYSISFSLYRFISSANTFFIIALTLVLLMVIFGSVFNDYFKDVSPSNGSDNSALDCFLLFKLENNSSLYPSSMYGVSLFYPFYATNQMLNISGRYIFHWISNDTFYWWPAPGYSVWDWQTSADYAWNGLKDQSWRFNILYFVPYIQSILWIGFGLLISKAKSRA